MSRCHVIMKNRNSYRRKMIEDRRFRLATRERLRALPVTQAEVAAMVRK